MMNPHGPMAHSTPSKTSSKVLRFEDVPPSDTKGIDGTDGASYPPTRFVFKRDLPSQHSNSGGNSSVVSDMERDTIIKQRTELQLLIRELRDRDRELNEMVHAHHTEMKAWQEDRQRSQSLEQRCAKLERDLNKRNNQLRELLKKLKAVEGEAVDSSSALESTRHQLQGLLAEHSAACSQLHQLEEYNLKLQESFKDTSQSLGDSEGRLSHYQHQLDIKEKEAMATNKEITDLASRLQSLEYAYKQLEKITFEVKTSANEWKNKYVETKQVTDNLKNELDIGNATMDEKDIELEKLRRELREKQDELGYTVERERRKDEMILLQKSKQERTDTELTSLRQMYDLQQHKLAAARKQLNEISEKELKHKCSFSHLDESSVLDPANASQNSTNASHNSTPNRSPLWHSHSSPPRRLASHSSPKLSSAHGSTTSDHVVTLQSRPVSNPLNSSTDRLQKLLSDSKRLVETITSNDSKSPTHTLAQLGLSDDR